MLSSVFLWLTLVIILVDAMETVDCGGQERYEDGVDGGMEFGSESTDGIGTGGIEPASRTVILVNWLMVQLVSAAPWDSVVFMEGC